MTSPLHSVPDEYVELRDKFRSAEGYEYYRECTEALDAYVRALLARAERAEVALNVCGVYLANRQAGNPDGYNRACRAVEDALQVTTVFQCAIAPTTSEGQEGA